VKILKEHYHEVFNHKVSINEKVLEHLKERTMSQELGEPPNQQQIMVAIQKMKNNKAPSITGVTTDMQKSLHIAAINLLTDVIQDFWMNPDCDFE